MPSIKSSLTFCAESGGGGSGKRRFSRAKIVSRKRTRLNIEPGKSLGNEGSSEDEESEEEEEDDDDEEREDNEDEEGDEEQDGADSSEGQQDDDDGCERIADEGNADEDEGAIGSSSTDGEESGKQHPKWMVVKFLIGRSYRHYVAKLLEENGSHLEVSCLRQRKDSAGKFYFPKRKDENCVSLDQVENTLPRPKQEEQDFCFPNKCFEGLLMC